MRLRLLDLKNPIESIHMLDHGRREFGAFYFLRAFHQTGKIVGHGLCANGAVHAFVNEVRRFNPA